MILLVLQRGNKNIKNGRIRYRETVEERVKNKVGNW